MSEQAAYIAKERPILFSAPMVKAILENKKTQTRRVITPQPKDCWMKGTDWSQYYKDGKKHLWIMHPEDHQKEIVCRYGAPGDRLWVRETWRAEEIELEPRRAGTDGIRFRADDAFVRIANRSDAGHQWIVAYDNGKHGKAWRPSIFMPRWASRITLEITEVRVERLQDISDDDCYAEGMRNPHYRRGSVGGDFSVRNVIFPEGWDAINKKRGFGWDVNPFVWVLTFKRKGNEQNED